MKKDPPQPPWPRSLSWPATAPDLTIRDPARLEQTDELGGSVLDGLKQAIDIPPFGELSDPRVLADLAAAADERGLDGFFLWDHIAYREPVSAVADPWVALAAIACATSRMRIGPMVTPLSRRRIHKLARETVTLDQLSDGRLTLGVGLGSDRNGELRALRRGLQPARAGRTARSRPGRPDQVLVRRLRAGPGAAAEDPGLGGLGVALPQAGPAGDAVGRPVPHRNSRPGRARRTDRRGPCGPLSRRLVRHHHRPGPRRRPWPLGSGGRDLDRQRPRPAADPGSGARVHRSRPALTRLSSPQHPLARPSDPCTHQEAARQDQLSPRIPSPPSPARVASPEFPARRTPLPTRCADLPTIELEFCP